MSCSDCCLNNITNIYSCFNERVVLITGAGGTLGGDAALMFARFGACLALIDNNKGRLDEINLRLTDNGHPENKVLSMFGNTNCEDDVDKLVQAAKMKFGKINHLVNIVGVKRLGNLESTSYSAIQENFTDIQATFNVTKACLPHLEASKGSVVNMSSVAGIITYGSAIPYGTAKAGLNHMTKMFAADLAKKGIRVNAICPSSVRSKFQVRNGTLQTQEQDDEYFKTAGKAIPLGRVSVPAEITQTILFLCSDAASFITGTIIPIDGGYSLPSK